MLKGTQRLIDSVWTLSYNLLEGNKIEILAYNREDVEGYEKERELPRATVIENPAGRIAIKVAVAPYEPFKSWVSPNDPDAKVYEVINPQFIFSY